ncbi:MAG: putative bifunctional diguanylate cyclase/phosphodiesterase [Hyphomonadaceae bacterium]
MRHLARSLPFGWKPRPLGLAGRASLYVALLVLSMAVVCVGTVVTAFRVDTAQHARRLAFDMAGLSGSLVAQRIATHDFAALERAVARMASPRHVTHASVHDLQGRTIAQAGAPATPMQARAVRDSLAQQMQGSVVTNDTVWTATPVRINDRVVGAVSVGVSRGELEAQNFPALAPFFLFFIAFVLVAAPLTVMVVRKRAQPLGELTAFAERISEKGLSGGQIDIRTGDEFEKLASAFNQMVARLEASMRRIQKLAYLDAATQLANQERFSRALKEYLARPEGAHGIGAVIVLDLDRLRRLLETLGESAAQDLLTRVAERLRVAVRNVDRMVRVQGAGDNPSLLARLRAHEFAVLAPSFAHEDEVARFAQMLASSINQPFDWRDLKLTLDCSVGAALAPRDGRDGDTLTRNARLALAAACTQNTPVKFFTKAMDREATSRLTLEQEMRAALERGEFRAFFQPKINLATGRVEGAEALARWVRPDNTIVSPAQFIPAAEETGLIGQLADAVMREACWKAAGWAREGFPVQVAVNVSPLQFRDERFPEHVIRILEHAGLPAFCLELEITESVAMENPEQALRMIEPLRQRGVRFAIDDFGCGHSSLAALTQLPFDVLKIDRQFVAGLEKDRHAPAIIETILAMAATLDMQVVAEGIEREPDAEFLRRRGCRYGQGFLYGAAEPAATFGERLRAERQPALMRDEDAA